MIDLCLRAADEAAMIDALPWARATDEAGDGIWIEATAGYALCVIGRLALDAGSYDAETGAELEPPVWAEGWHANLRLLDEALADLVPAELVVAPSSPRVRWL